MLLFCVLFFSQLTSYSSVITTVQDIAEAIAEGTAAVVVGTTTDQADSKRATVPTARSSART